jgi:hypothetical protein
MIGRKVKRVGPTPEESRRKYGEFTDKQVADTIGKRWPNPYPTLQTEVDRARLAAALYAEKESHAELQKVRAGPTRGGENRGKAVREERIAVDRKVRSTRQKLRRAGERGTAKQIANELDWSVRKVAKILTRIKSQEEIPTS